MGAPSRNRGRTTHDYVHALEQELTKIQAFHRELPLSLDIVARTIESCRRELVEDRPVLEEFIPMNESSDRGIANDDKNGRSDGSEAQDKMNWLRSAALWNQHQQLAEQRNDVTGTEGDVNDDDGEDGGAVVAEEERMKKKARRSWSPDLQQKFLDVLEKLGGPEVATPKQIREMMGIEGLTTNEIKSHLQKHRIRLKKSAQCPKLVTGMSDNRQPQVLFGIWMPQGDYAAVAAAAAAAIASIPLEAKPKKQRRRKQSKKNASVPALGQLQNAMSIG